MIVEFKTTFLRSVKKLKDKKLTASIYNIIIECESVKKIEAINNIKKLKGFQSFTIESG